MFRAALLLIACLALVSAGEAAPPAAEFPFVLENGFILVEAQLAGAGPALTFLVDSGASVSVLNVAAARRLHLPLGAQESVRGVGAEAAAYRLRDVRLFKDGVRLCAAEMAVDLGNAEPLCGRAVDGLLGMGFFAERVVQIDYTARKIRFLSAAPPADPAATSLPLRRLNGIFCTAVSVNGSQPRWTRLDTGCNDALHWVIPRSSSTGRRGATIGFLNEQRDLTCALVRLGDLEVPQVETSLHGRPLFPGEAGLLGNALLSRYTITIDAKQQTLSLRH